MMYSTCSCTRRRPNRNDVVREERQHRVVRLAVAELDRRLHDDEQPEGRDEPGDGRRGREQPQHQQLEQQRDEHRGQDAAHDATPIGHPFVVRSSRNVMYEASIPSAPWAKFTMPEPR